MEIAVAECILFSLYLPKPNLIPHVFFEKHVRYSCFSGHLWLFLIKTSWKALLKNFNFSCGSFVRNILKNKYGYLCHYISSNQKTKCAFKKLILDVISYSLAQTRRFLHHCFTCLEQVYQSIFSICICFRGTHFSV